MNPKFTEVNLKDSKELTVWEKMAIRRQCSQDYLENNLRHQCKH